MIGISARWTAILAMTTLMSGCGGVFISTQDLPKRYPAPSEEEPVKTFQVSTFELRAANAPTTYDQDFSEGLKDYLQNRSAMTMESSGAQMRISGEILTYEVQPVSIVANNEAAQNRLTIRVKVDVSFPKDPKRDVSSGLSRFADFNSDQDLSTVEDALLEQINEQLFQDILNLLRPDW